MKLLQGGHVVADHIQLISSRLDIFSRPGMLCLSPGHTKAERNALKREGLMLMLDDGTQLPVEIQQVSDSCSNGSTCVAYFRSALLKKQEGKN